MNLDMFFQLMIILLGYSLGAGIVRFFAYLMGGVSMGKEGWLLFFLPVALMMIAEAFIKLWRHIPGSFGLGGLSVVTPALLVGALSMITFYILAIYFKPIPNDSVRQTDVNIWVGSAYLLGAIALVMWRYWPGPRARLW